MSDKGSNLDNAGKTRVFAIKVSGTKGPVLIVDDLNDAVCHLEDGTGPDDWYEIQCQWLTDAEMEQAGEFDGF